MLFKDLLDEHIRRECLERISVTLASSERWCANTILYLVCSSNKFWGISSDGRASALHAEGQRFDPVILHQYRPPLLNLVERPRERGSDYCCNSNSLSRKIKRPDVIDQGTLQVVTLLCLYGEIGRHAGFRYQCASVGVRVPLQVPYYERSIL